MKTNNEIITIQEYLMRQMQRLDNDETMKQNGTEEIARSNSLSNTATTYLKAVNTTLRILETSSKNEQTASSLMKTLGITED